MKVRMVMVDSTVSWMGQGVFGCDLVEGKMRELILYGKSDGR